MSLILEWEILTNENNKENEMKYLIVLNGIVFASVTTLSVFFNDKEMISYAFSFLVISFVLFFVLVEEK